MQTVIDNMRDLLPVAAVFWALLLIAVLRKPQRFRNSLLLMVTVGVTLMLVAGLFGDYMGFALVGIFLLTMLGLLVAPILLIINGVYMIRRESVSFANVLSLLLGIVIALGEFAMIFAFWRIMLWNGVPLIHKILFLLGLSVFYFCFLLLGFVLYTLFIQFMPHRMNFDHVIIHGAGLLNGREVSKLLADRMDKAIDIYRKCEVKPVLIPSGGKGSDEDISEAEAMAGYLRQHGIPEEHILLEDQSTTTMENLANSKAIIDARQGERIALVSSNYHVYRCLTYAKKIKMKCVGIGAHVAWYYWPSALIREFVAVFSGKGNLIRILLGYILFMILPVLWMLAV